MLTAETELARREGGRIVVRPVGVRLRWELTDLTSSDGHAIRGAFAATLRPVDDTAERKLLEESLLSDRPTLTSADAAAYFLALWNPPRGEVRPPWISIPFSQTPAAVHC